MTTAPPYHRPAQRVRLTVLAAVAAVAAIVLPAQTAHAANYQYWGYYKVAAGAWTFSDVGPDKSTPADGATEGWRFAVDDGTGTTPRLPRALPTFAAVCDATPAETGKKRVAVVIDPGRTADGDGTTTPPEPVTKCASVASAATGAEVIAAVSPVRAGSGGLVCALGGYPASGCGAEVATLTDAQKAPDTPVSLATPTPSASATSGPSAAAAPATAPAASASSGFPGGVVAGLVAVLVVVAALVWGALRRRRTAA